MWLEGIGARFRRWHGAGQAGQANRPAGGRLRAERRIGFGLGTQSRCPAEGCDVCLAVKSGRTEGSLRRRP